MAKGYPDYHENEAITDVGVDSMRFHRVIGNWPARLVNSWKTVLTITGRGIVRFMNWRLYNTNFVGIAIPLYIFVDGEAVPSIAFSLNQLYFAIGQAIANAEDLGITERPPAATSQAGWLRCDVVFQREAVFKAYYLGGSGAVDYEMNVYASYN